jgi:hypothetical protein
MAAVDTSRTPLRITLPPPTVASAAPPSLRIGDDGFLSEATVDGWVRSGAASRAGSLLTSADGRRFVLRDALRVIGRRNGDTDPYGLTGRVEAIRDFVRRGASVSPDALKLGPAVYDVEYGFVAAALEAGERTM